MEKLQNTIILKCPHCGREYLPGEIFCPGELIGKSKSIIRDALGKKIIYLEYEKDEEPCFTEKFVCEECGKEFIVEATLSFKTKEQ